jgi:hypothetical protein
MAGIFKQRHSEGIITSGWLSFGALLLLFVGFFNLIDGIIALTKNEYFLVPPDRLPVFGYTAWGWIWIVIGIAQFVIGGCLLARQGWARIAGAAIAILAAIGQLLFLAAFPLWSIIIIILCVLAIYGMTVPPSKSVAV